MSKHTKPNGSNGKSEAERFVSFARKLMSVPKEEIDEQQAIYEKEKQPGKKRERFIVEEG